MPTVFCSIGLGLYANSNERKALGRTGVIWGGYSGREMGGVEIGRFATAVVLIYYIVL